MEATEIRKLLELHARGRVTEHELLCLLVQFAATHRPAAIAAQLPPHRLADLRTACESPPKSSDDVLFVEFLDLSLVARGDFVWEAYRRDCAERFCDGAWQWHWYFDARSVQLPAA